MRWSVDVLLSLMHDNDRGELESSMCEAAMSGGHVLSEAHANVEAISLESLLEATPKPDGYV